VALIKCPECGREISDKAEVCPHCGYPVPKDAAQPTRQATSPSSQPAPPTQQPSPPNTVGSASTFIPEPAAVAAAQSTIKKLTILPGGKWSEAVGGKLRIDGSRLLIKKLIREQFVFNLSHVESLEHKGSRLLVKTRDKHFVIHFNEFGEKADRMKEAFAKLTGKPLPPKPAGMPLDQAVKYAVVGVAVVAVVIVSIVKILSNDPVVQEAKEEPARTALLAAEEAEKRQPAAIDHSKGSREATPDEMAAWKKKHGYPTQPAGKKIKTAGSLDEKLELQLQLCSILEKAFLSDGYDVDCRPSNGQVLFIDFANLPAHMRKPTAHRAHQQFRSDQNTGTMFRDCQVEKVHFLYGSALSGEYFLWEL